MRICGDCTEWRRHLVGNTDVTHISKQNDCVFYPWNNRFINDLFNTLSGLHDRETDLHEGPTLIFVSCLDYHCTAVST